MMRRNWITVFTEDELRAALALTNSPESAAAVAAELYAMTPGEQEHLEWIQDALLQLSCVSDELAARVLDNFASSPDERARMQAEQARFRELVPETGNGDGVVELDDVVWDSRKDTALRTALKEDHGNDIAVFTEDELRVALEMIATDPAAAASVAAELYGLPPEEQHKLIWTDLALGLLAAQSDTLGERVLAHYGGTPQRESDIREMQSLLREMAAANELPDSRVQLDVEHVVRRGS